MGLVKSTSPPFRIRAYNPETDYSGVARTLREANLFDEDRDTEALLCRYADSVIVADAYGPEGESTGIIGNVYVTRGIMPIVYRLAVRRAWQNQGIGELLVAGAMNLLDSDGHPDIGVFVNVNEEAVRGWYDRRGFIEAGAYVEMWRHI